MKHKYADVLIAIAEGKQIQFKENGRWVNCTDYFALVEIVEEYVDSIRFRVEPTPVTH